MAERAFNNVTLLLIATFAIAITIPCVEANIGQFDDYLREKAEQARRAALEAYEHDPFNVTSEFNMHVHLAMDEFNNGTRRALLAQKDKGPCMITNPIDRCWRCDKNWAKNRFKLAWCAKGFGRKTTGGLGGPIYVVTDNSDDLVNPKPGTLSMVIQLKGELLVTSNKTIDGRGANVQIKGGSGITLQYVNNVIIHGLRIKNIKSQKGGLIRDAVDHVGLRTRSDGDGISLFGATNVWIDHISMSNADDGLIDIIMASTGITISNCHLTKHNDVMLFGANDLHVGDKVMQVTVAFNFFGQGLTQRMPRCRFGWFHVVNNHYTHWQMHAIGGSSNPTILSQGNRYIAPNNPHAKMITYRHDTPESVWRKWQWTTEMDAFVNGAIFIPSGKPVSKAGIKNLIKPRPGVDVRKLTRYAGALNCKVGQPC
ncbi:pectate lyase-like [Senna tora]|uniref:Pectate lyase n=1 Tax=Senna tora TaxID=362788 RepID=A0A834VZM2_9FABA|nr:pectate lyase-like [Senna tora]